MVHQEGGDEAKDFEWAFAPQVRLRLREEEAQTGAASPRGPAVPLTGSAAPSASPAAPAAGPEIEDRSQDAPKVRVAARDVRVVR